MKLHVALDPQDQQVWAVELSTNSVDDAQIVKPLLQAVPCTINSVTGDGAYDKVKVREQLCRRAAEQKEDILQLMCLQKNAIPDVKHRDCTRQRDEDIKAIRRLGKRQWKVLSGYLRRSLAETFMFRYKVILGDHLKGRTFENQQTEVKLGARILNLMLETAKPKSERVA